MKVALWLLTIQGVIGAFDTFYYHEWRARLPARAALVAPELKLHAARDVLYALLFGTLPWLAYHGIWVIALACVLTSEIALTLSDFVVEATVRKPFGDVYAGERVTHAIMGILYGLMLAHLVPALRDWWTLPTALVVEPAPVPDALRWVMMMMAAGVLASGMRDLAAAFGLPHGHWPWTVTNPPGSREGR